MTSSRLPILLWLMVSWYFAPIISGEFLDEPVLAWTATLPGGGSISGPGFRKDNAVAVSADDSIVFATADDGKLHAFSAVDGEVLFTYGPGQLSDGSYTECRSGVVIMSDYVVYAVIDTPTNSDGDVKSRVIAVNNDGSERWVSELDGFVVGTPVFGGSDKIYVSHNLANINDGSGFVPFRGQVAVINASSGAKVGQVSALNNRLGPFGPLTIQTKLLEEDYTVRDYVFWSESWGDGYIEAGHVYSLEAYMDDDGRDIYNLQTLSEWGRPSVTKPVVGTGGNTLYVGASRSVLGGWIGINEGTLPLAMSWTSELEPSERNVTQPFLSAGVLSSDGQFIFLAGASYDLYSIDAQTGAVVWEDIDSQSVFMGEPILSEPIGDGSGVLYAIEARTGRVRQHDAFRRGDRIWEFSCADISGILSCEDSVEADSSASSAGDYLYYGDIYGKIAALQVGNFKTPAPVSLSSDAPSAAPVITGSRSPSVMPVAEPSMVQPTMGQPTIASPSPTNDPTGDASGSLGAQSNGGNDDGINILYIAIPVGVAVLLGAAVLLLVAGKRRRRAKSFTGTRGPGTLVTVGSKDDSHVDGEGGTSKGIRRGDRSEMIAEEAVLAPETAPKEKLPLSKSARRKSKSKKESPPRTPSTLASIEEVPGAESWDSGYVDGEGVEVESLSSGPSNSVKVSDGSNASPVSNAPAYIAAGTLNVVARSLLDDDDSGSESEPTLKILGLEESGEGARVFRAVSTSSATSGHVSPPVGTASDLATSPLSNASAKIATATSPVPDRPISPVTEDNQTRLVTAPAPFDEEEPGRIYPSYLGLKTTRAASPVQENEPRQVSPPVSPAHSALSDDSGIYMENGSRIPPISPKPCSTLSSNRPMSPAVSETGSKSTFDLADLVSVDGSSLYIEDDEDSKASRRSLRAPNETAAPSPRLTEQPTQPPSAPERHFSEEPKPARALSGSEVTQPRPFLRDNYSVSSQSASTSSHESNQSSANISKEKSDEAFHSFVREVRKSQKATHTSLMGVSSAREKITNTSNDKQKPSMWSSLVDKVSQAEKSFFDPIPAQRTIIVPQRPTSPEHPEDELTDEDQPPPLPPSRPPPPLS